MVEGDASEDQEEKAVEVVELSEAARMAVGAEAARFAEAARRAEAERQAQTQLVAGSACAAVLQPELDLDADAEGNVKAECLAAPMAAADEHHQTARALRVWGRGARRDLRRR